MRGDGGAAAMQWTQMILPIRLKQDKSTTTTTILPYTDPKIPRLPIKQRSVRVLAENFCWIVKHIQTISRTQLVPKYQKSGGTSSLTRLGFTTYNEEGISRRPNLPNAEQTYQIIQTMLQTMPRPTLPHRNCHASPVTT